MSRSRAARNHSPTFRFSTRRGSPRHSFWRRKRNHCPRASGFSPGFVPGTSFRSLLRSPSLRPARRWDSRRRRWPSSMPSRARSRITSPSVRIVWRPRVPPKFESVLTSDNGIREDTSYEQLAALKPVFDRKYGSVTAGNSSPLTDGGACVLLMSEEKARSLGYPTLGIIRSYAYAALDPGEQLLQAPVLAAPVALKRAGLTLKDMDLVEMHEAFAAQVLSNLKGFESKWWAERAGFSQPVGEVDRAKLNVMGGSIAIGHPFGATGARITTTLLNELRRRGGQFGLMTVCSAGGMGFAMVVERTR